MKISFFFALTLLTSAAFAMNHAQHGASQAAGGDAHFEPRTEAGLTLSKFWVRASIGMAPNSAAYGRIAIEQGTDRLISAASPLVDTIELHEHIHDQGVMRMREVEGGFTIAEGQPLVMQPGGYHIMLLGVRSALAAGETLPLTLTLASGQTIELNIPIVSVNHMGH